MARRRRIAVSSFALLVAAWALLERLTGVETGLLYVAPALVLCAPLFCGRYVGERQLAGLAGRSAAPAIPRPAPQPMPRSHVRLMQRGGRLVACALAKRPPPAGAPLPA
jgi:hypothetical protein